MYTTTITTKAGEATGSKPTTSVRIEQYYRSVVIETVTQTWGQFSNPETNT